MMKLYPKVTWHKVDKTYTVEGITLTADQVYAMKGAYDIAVKEGRQ